MKCPRCEGKGEVIALTATVYGRTKFFVPVKCGTCVNGVAPNDLPLRVEIGAAIRKRRREAGRSLLDEAERLNVTVTEISRIELGDADPLRLYPEYAA